ncbi:hypothetical protein GJ496_002288 [Pomphorhynchus laevis]|nr:hypothetical protein GJ496_002288 [Pomphorhynchus laevis]
MIEADSGGNLLDTLTHLVNHLLSGSVPNSLAPFIAGANLFGLPKKDGGIRPVAASLPFRLGGFGLRNTTIHSSNAFVKSVRAVCEISSREPNQYVGFEGALSELSVLTGKDNLQHICSDDSTTSFHIDRLRFDRLLEESNNLDKARLRATACSKAATWLQVTLIISQVLDLTPTQFCVFCRMWLGLAIFPPNHKCGRCYSDTDLLGFHALTCQYGGHRGFRYSSAFDIHPVFPGRFTCYLLEQCCAFLAVLP